MLQKGLVVSCQAQLGDALFVPGYMAKMAKAAQDGGAVGIRAHGVADITDIKKDVNLPIIGINKHKYEGYEVFITPTLEDVELLVALDIEVVALDATARPRPDGRTLEETMRILKEKYPQQVFMADVDNLENALLAEKCGFDVIAPTLVGYTKESEGLDNFKVLASILDQVKRPVIAEGNFDTPEKARRAMEMGCLSVVVGSAITRPQLITKKFVDEMSK